MKNLKKVLALVLAFACAFTMFAGAAFTDQADINDVNADAVDLLTTLNIIKGYEDGSFQPDGTVTRAEMAKMIYTIRNDGNDDASPYETVTTSFTDISGHWAEGYIKYLQNTGIVAGKSDYIFDPDSTVTTGEAMKMALVLAGYRADKAELTGTKWLNNTVSLATTVGMTKDVQSTIAGGCTRQDAAQILSNTLTEVYAVQWSEVTNSFLNDSKEGLAFAGQRITVGDKWMDLVVYVGRMTASGELQITNDAAGKDRFVVDVDTRNNVSWERVMSFKDGKDHTDLVGQEVKVLTGEKIDEVYGVYATGTSNVVETTMDQVSVQSDWKVKVDGTTYNTKDTQNAFVDLEGAQAFAAVFSANGRVAADGVKLIDWDNDGKFETVLVNTVTVAKVNSVTDASVTVGFTGTREPAVFGNTRTIDFDGNNVAEGIAKGDYIAITQNLYDDTWNVAKVDKVEGTVNGLVKNEYKIRVEGEWYTLANNKATTATLYVVPGGRTTFTNGDKIVMYTIGNTVYFADSSTGNDANRSVLMAYDSNMTGGTWNNDKQAKVILADGTKKTVNVVKIDDTASSAFTNNHGKIGELVVGQMYSYSINNDGDYTLTTIGAANLAGYDSYVDNAAGVQGSKVQTRMIADDAVVFALIIKADGTVDADVYTGKTVKNTGYTDGWGDTPNGGVLIEETNGIDYARMFNIEIDTVLDESSNYAVLLSDAVRSKSDSQYIEYHMWTGSEVVDVKEKTDAKNELTMLDGDVISYENDGEGMIKSVSKVNDGVKGLQASVLGYANGDIRLLDQNGDDRAYEINSDSTVIYFNTNNSDDARGVTGDGYDYPATLDDAGDHYVNAVYVLDNNKDAIKFILIDINGKLTGKTVEELNGVLWDHNASDIGADGLQGVLNKFQNVRVTGDVKLDRNTTVAAGKKLVILGNLDMNHNNLIIETGAEVIVRDELWIHSTFSGTITVGSLRVGDSTNVGNITSTSVITVTGTQNLTDNTVVQTTGIEAGAKFIQGETTYTATSEGGSVTLKPSEGSGETPEDPDDPVTPPVTGELPAPSEDPFSGDVTVPYTGTLSINAIEQALAGTEWDGWKVTSADGKNFTATNPADDTDTVKIVPTEYLQVSVTDWNGTTVTSAYLPTTGGKIENVPVGDYLNSVTNTQATKVEAAADATDTTVGTLTVGAVTKDTATFKPAIQVKDSGSTVDFAVGTTTVTANNFVQVGSELTITGKNAVTTGVYGQIYLGDAPYGEVSKIGDGKLKAEAKYTISAADKSKTDLTFTVKEVAKLTIDGTAVKNAATGTDYFVVGDSTNDSYVAASLVSDKKYMVTSVSPLAAAVSTSVYSVEAGSLWLNGASTNVGTIDKNAIVSSNAKDGTIALTEAVMLNKNSGLASGSETFEVTTAKLDDKDITMTAWSDSAGAYVPVGAVITLTAKSAADQSFTIAADPESVSVTTKATAGSATGSTKASLQFKVPAGATSLTVEYK